MPRLKREQCIAVKKDRPIEEIVFEADECLRWLQEIALESAIATACAETQKTEIQTYTLIFNRASEAAWVLAPIRAVAARYDACD